MLQSSFKNYDEFKELFVRAKANGETTRRNGVLLAFLTSKAVWDYIKSNESDIRSRYFDVPTRAELNSMGALYSVVKNLMAYADAKLLYTTSECLWEVTIIDRTYYSNKYAADGKKGICIDGDFSAYRYQNQDRGGQVFKMKVGRMFRHLIDLTDLKDVLPESVKLWFCEEITREWEAYAAASIPDGIELHVDDDFRSIYDCGGDTRCYGHFGSCMQNAGDHWRFYRDSVNAKAAYLTQEIDGEARIIARCVIFTNVTREDTGEVIRVAERQYSTDGNDLYQRILIKKLKDGGYIDAYKKTGAGCGDARAFVDLEGNSMSNVDLHIDCDLDSGDYLSYQDSFKWYNECDRIAYNYDADYADGVLDSTDLYYDEEEDEDDGEWDSWHERSAESVSTVYVNGREYTCDDNDMEDFTYVEYGSGRGEYHHNEDVTYCYDIDGYVLSEDAHYSDLLGEDYYDYDQMAEEERQYKKDNGWAYAEYNDDYYEDEEDIESIITDVLYDGSLERQTIFRRTLERLVDNGIAVRDEETGNVYMMRVLKTLSA